MTFAPGTPVLLHEGVGEVGRSHAHGYAYDVILPSGMTIICTACALREAPSNVLVFRKRPPANPYGEMYEL